MKKIPIKEFIWPLACAAALGLELLLLADTAVLFWERGTSLITLCAIWMVLTLGYGWILGWRPKRICAAMCAVPVVAALLVASGIAGWRSFSASADYAFADDGKERLFGNRKVMLIVPHQDDDINVLGGAMEEYIRYGSGLYPVFVTNGDYLGLPESRYREALDVFGYLGVPEEQVFFLGYGDDWNADGPHLYNAEPGVVLQSHAGKTQTYGTELHAAYREGRTYTIDHLMEDLKDVILEVKPDVIFCSDYDAHIDHKALTLLFDKVMGQLLKEHPDYQPVVYKAFAYSTAWEAEPDYYSDNILSTKNPFEDPIGQKPEVYQWEKRIRLPVDGSLLSRSLLTSDAFALMKRYESQGAQAMAAKVTNGDKVAWRRETDSLCLQADIVVSSGNGSLLNDFMLMENHDLRDWDRLPYDGVWIPEQLDEERTITVVLKERTDIDTIQLYDHPAAEHNVLNATILFEDGTRVETGALLPTGAATAIPVRKQDVSEFRIVLTETEGDCAGLSEVEAFADPPETDGVFLKLMDKDENFLYDYITPTDGNAELLLYGHGTLPELSEENYTLRTDSERAEAVWQDGVIRIHCPEGEVFSLEVSCEAAGVSDRIVVRNPGALERFWTNLWSGVEEMMFSRYCQYPSEDLLISAALRKVSNLMGRFL